MAKCGARGDSAPLLFTENEQVGDADLVDGRSKGFHNLH